MNNNKFDQPEQKVHSQLFFHILVVMISRVYHIATFKWRHQRCLLPGNAAKDLTLKLRVAKTGEEEQRAPAKRQRRKRQERRQEAEKDFGDFGEKDLEGKRCGNMVDTLMILMKWKLMLILLVERFGGTCIRSCGPNLSSCSFLEKSVGEFQPGVCTSNIIEIVLEMNHHTYWPWVAYLSTILYCLATLGFR